MSAIRIQTERKPQDRSVCRAENRRYRARKMQVRRPIRPAPGVCATTDTAQGERSLFNRRNQAILSPDGRPLGECRLGSSYFYVGSAIEGKMRNLFRRRPSLGGLIGDKIYLPEKSIDQLFSECLEKPGRSSWFLAECLGDLALDQYKTEKKYLHEAPFLVDLLRSSQESTYASRTRRKTRLAHPDARSEDEAFMFFEERLSFGAPDRPSTGMRRAVEEVFGASLVELGRERVIETALASEAVEQISTHSKEEIRRYLASVPFTVAMREKHADTLGQMALEKALRDRAEDLLLIERELVGAQEALEPALRKSLRRRVDEFGDEDLTSFYKVVFALCERRFPRCKMNFFVGLYPILVVAGNVWPWFSGGSLKSAAPQDGLAFEHWCASKLKEMGWRADVSKAAGDQGVDIEAEKRGVRVAIQCKRYTSAIGNKAVQEACTGAQNTQAHFACVLGTGGFTRSANELAEGTGVVLLDASQIGDFDRVFQKKDKPDRA